MSNEVAFVVYDFTPTTNSDLVVSESSSIHEISYTIQVSIVYVSIRYWTAEGIYTDLESFSVTFKNRFSTHLSVSFNIKL